MRGRHLADTTHTTHKIRVSKPISLTRSCMYILKQKVCELNSSVSFIGEDGVCTVKLETFFPLLANWALRAKEASVLRYILCMCKKLQKIQGLREYNIRGILSHVSLQAILILLYICNTRAVWRAHFMKNSVESIKFPLFEPRTVWRYQIDSVIKLSVQQSGWYDERRKNRCCGGDCNFRWW